jgi:hypothetical protein
MMTLARKFLRRPAADRRLLVRALALHACLAALVRLVRFGRLNQWLAASQANQANQNRPAPAGHAPDRVSIERVVWAVQTATTVVPWGKTCLTEALTTSVLLRRVGCDATLRYGVAADNERPLAAHAWLEYRGDIVIGGSTARSYETLRQARRTT